jgi:hypothetical protein
MLTPEERALLTDQQDRLIDLFVQRDEAIRAEHWDQARDLKSQIDDARCEADAIRHEPAGAPWRTRSRAPPSASGRSVRCRVC